MLLEDIMLLMMLGMGIFFVGIPAYKLVRTFLPQKKRNPLAEAQERLETARLEAEAAKLNQQAEQLYEHMYQDVLADEDVTHKQEKK